MSETPTGKKRAPKPKAPAKAKAPAKKRRPAKAAPPAKGKRPVKAKRPAKAAPPAKVKRRRLARPRLSPEQRERVGSISRARHIGVVATAVALACGTIVGALLFARPTTSEVERRTLTAMPSFGWGSFWDGSFLSDLSLWYSDTYPGREQLVSTNRTLEALHGIKTQTQVVGTTKQADELPPADESKDDSREDKKDRGPVKVPTEEEMAAAIQDQITDGLYVKGDAAFNIYYFSQEAVGDYADAINTLASDLKGQAQVYSVVVPNASGVVLSEQEIKDLGGTNQEDALRYFYSLYDDSVRSVDTISELKKHADEYIYYRTDHHWTALGSYYGYVAFCKERGTTPGKLDDMKYLNIGDFLGSFASQLNSAEMEANPDYLEAWIPRSTNKLTLYDTDGSKEQYEIVTDMSNEGPYGKSLAFIMGDQPLEEINNPKLDDGSSCLVIKDSFGDTFVPYLVDDYQTIWVADFRYFEGGYIDFVRDHDIKDVIVVNNISLAGGGTVAPAILGKL